MTDDLPSRFERLWTIEQAADYLVMSKQTLYGWRCRGTARPVIGWATSCGIAPMRCACGSTSKHCRGRGEACRARRFLSAGGG